MKFTNKFAFLLFILATVTFSSCKDKTSTNILRSPKGKVHLGGTLRIAEIVLPVSLVPNQITDAISSQIGSQIHSGLLDFDVNTLEIMPAIAESWSVNDVGTSYIFHLRSGALFHANDCFGNGSREITATDFKYSFMQLCSKNSLAFATTFKNRVKGATAFYNGETETLVGVQIIDDYTLKIELVKPDPSFLYVLAQPSTAVISEKAMQKYGENMRVGAGAFILSKDENGLLLIRNKAFFLRDEYGNQLPYIDTMFISSIASKEKQLEAFFNDEIDLITDLHLDPVRQILERHVADFSGKNPKYIMNRESESIGYESYSILQKRVIGFNNNFMGYRNFSRVQLSTLR